ncbi:hypothetical protein BLA18109_01087 [Burkholderia lata]|uniref:Uncharacterized protein n=1 Tax=Burkholderia lata (strain ATCC 17760 / DSM 23089 / LMG 22485 / NCIMB 9086 / R18194 / 383) TaxID=482957 RepID=A0A6P2TIR3_BURL3|nr:hypothetical protein BLA18109_01087 [Burkholderia lata]
MFGGEQSVSHVTGRRWHGPTDLVSTIWALVSNVSSWSHPVDCHCGDSRRGQTDLSGRASL